VIGLLTILGFSLYDAVVVFDKVKENTRGILGLTRRTFGEEANLALNQTLMRSINTSLIALLPVLGLLVVGIGLLGVGTLTDLALVAAGRHARRCRIVAAAGHPVAGGPEDASGALPAAGPSGAVPPQAPGRTPGTARRGGRRRRYRVTADDDEIADEVRRERAYAAAASVPARTPKASQNRKPAGKPGRPTGKRKR